MLYKQFKNTIESQIDKKSLQSIIKNDILSYQNQLQDLT